MLRFAASGERALAACARTSGCFVEPTALFRSVRHASSSSSNGGSSGATHRPPRKRNTRPPAYNSGRPPPISFRAAVQEAISPAGASSKSAKTTSHLGTTRASDSRVDIFSKGSQLVRTHLQARDVQRAWNEWLVLERQGLLTSLGPPHLDPIATALAQCVPLGHPGAFWDTGIRGAVENMALYLAVARFPSALLACMVYHLRGSTPQDALDLYAQYEKAAAEADAWLEEDVEDAVEDDTAPATAELTGLSSVKGSSTRYVATGAAELRIAAYAAYAQQGDLAGALHTHLGSALRIRNLHSHAHRFAERHLAGDTLLPGKLAALVSRLETAQLASRPAWFVRHIAKLGADHHTDKLARLYDAVLAGLAAGPDGWLAPEPGRESAMRPVGMPPAAWASFVHAFVLCGQFERVGRAWEDMTRHSIMPGTAVWAALISAYGATGDVERARSTWEAMVDRGLKPDAEVYSALLPCLFAAGASDPTSLAEALELFEQFKNGKPDMQAPATVAVYNTVLHGLLIRTREPEARVLLEEMRTVGPKPDIVSFNTLLRYYGRSKDLRSIASILQMCAEDGVKPDTFTFSTILSAMLKTGRKDALTLVTGLMRQHGVEPNVATYTAIIDSQVRERDEAHLKAALELLTMMELDGRKDVQPNQVTYTTLITGIFRGGFLAPPVADEYVQSILVRMRQRDVLPNRTTYHVLIATSLRDQSPEGIERALGYYHEMKRRRIAMTLDTWYMLINGLAIRKQWAAANELVNEMLAADFKPHGALLELMARIQRHTTMFPRF